MQKRTTLIMLLFTVVAFAISGAYYDQLPERMATHWDGNDRVNGHTDRVWGAFIVPLILLVLTILMALVLFRGAALPGLERGGRAVTAFVVVLFAFFDLIHLQVIHWNIGNQVSFAVTVPIGIGIVFIAVGFLLGAVDRNWIVGIRTYWTLKDPVVWDRTHQRASLLFKILGIIYVLAAFFREYILLFMLLPAVFLALYLPAYSFLLYQKIEDTRKGGKR